MKKFLIFILLFGFFVENINAWFPGGGDFVLIKNIEENKEVIDKINDLISNDKIYKANKLMYKQIFIEDYSLLYKNDDIKEIIKYFSEIIFKSHKLDIFGYKYNILGLNSTNGTLIQDKIEYALGNIYHQSEDGYNIINIIPITCSETGEIILNGEILFDYISNGELKELKEENYDKEFYEIIKKLNFSSKYYYNKIHQYEIKMFKNELKFFQENFKTCDDLDKYFEKTRKYKMGFDSNIDIRVIKAVYYSIFVLIIAGFLSICYFIYRKVKK